MFVVLCGDEHDLSIVPLPSSPPLFLGFFFGLPVILRLKGEGEGRRGERAIEPEKPEMYIHVRNPDTRIHANFMYVVGYQFTININTKYIPEDSAYGMGPDWDGMGIGIDMYQ